MRVLTFEGVTFNVDVNRRKNKKEFVEFWTNNGLYSHSTNRIKLIEEAYRLIKACAKTKLGNDDLTGAV